MIPTASKRIRPEHQIVGDTNKTQRGGERQPALQNRIFLGHSGSPLADRVARIDLARSGGGLSVTVQTLNIVLGQRLSMPSDSSCQAPGKRC